MNLCIMDIKKKLKIDKYSLEVSNKSMELGKAYLYMRGDDSFMLHSNRESYGGHWFGQDWFDFCRHSIHIESKATCVINPVKMEITDEYDVREFISGTYAIDDETCQIISNASFKAFSIIAPVVEDIERNLMYYSFNEQHRSDETYETYIEGEVNTIDFEPGTCILTVSRETGQMHIERIKNRRVQQGSRCENTRDYSSDTFSVNFKEGLRLSHTIDGNYYAVSLIDNDIVKEIEHGKIKRYFIPSDVFEHFSKTYIKAVNEIQDIRTAVLEVVLDNHEKAYGTEYRKKAEENVYKWLK